MATTYTNKSRVSKRSFVVGSSPLTRTQEFDGFMHPHNVKLQELEKKMEEMRERIRAMSVKWSMLPTLTPVRSYAHVAARKCEPHVFVPVAPKRATVLERPMSPWDVRRASAARAAERKANNELAACIAARYNEHYLVQKQRTAERQANNLLAASIAARYRDIPSVPEVPYRISRYEARQDYLRALRLREQQRQYCRGLAASIALRYAEQYDERLHAPKAEWDRSKAGVERSIRGPCTRKKSVKPVIIPEEENWDSLLSGLVREEFPGLSRVPEKVSLSQVLLSTSAGRTLLIALLQRKLSLQNIHGSEIEQVLRSATSIMESVRTLPQEGIVEAQMESNPESAQGSTTVDAKSNVVLESGIPLTDSIPTERGYYPESSSQQEQVYSTLSDRWIRLTNVKWSSGSEVGAKLASIKIPYSIIREYTMSQNAALFLQHRFYRSNVVLKFECNSTRFQVGMLVASVLYHEPGSRSYNQDNYASALQRLNVKIIAGAPYAGELRIPYQYPNSCLSLDEAVDFCTVSFYVVNPLAVPATSSSSCTISCFISFEDAQFNGVIARNMQLGLPVEPQMDSVEKIGNLVLNPSVSGAVNVASSVLQTLGADSNRDNPPIPLQPMSFIPQGIGSFCTTTNTLCPVNVLRSDPTGQVPHRSSSDDMSIPTLKNTWGLLKTFTWDPSQDEGECLWYTPVAPLLPLAEYPTRVPTPIAMLASLFGFWRGSLEFKIEIVANAYYKGKVMVTGVPLADAAAPPALREAQFSANATFSVSDVTEKVFSFPWNWYNSFARTRSSEDMYDSIGLLQVFVINPLVAIDNVPPKAYINLYVRGGSDFEIAIPRPSMLYFGSQEAILPPTTQSPTAYNLESAWYTTFNRNCVSKSGKYPLVPYISNITDGWVGYTNLRPGYIYQLGNTLKGKEFRLLARTDANDKTKVVQIKYGTYDVALSTANAHGMVVSHSKTVLANYVRKLKTHSVEEAREELVGDVYWVADGPWSQVKVNNRWVTATDKEDPPVWQWVPMDRLSIDDSIPLIITFTTIKQGMKKIEPPPQPQMRRAVRLGKPSPLTNSGLSVFGEQVPDLKAYCRRFNLLGSTSLKTCSRGLAQDCPYAAVVRVCPIRTIAVSSSSCFNNRYQEGPISAIGEMYRFWKGGLRFRFVVSGNPPEGTQMFISHRYDMVSPSVNSIYANPSAHAITKDDLLHTQYASYCQTLSVNQSFTIEVPYYQEREYLSCLDNLDHKWTDNGCLQIWCFSKVEANIDLEIYYSFADDTHFKLFQGLGQAKDITTIAPEPTIPNLVRPQMNNPFEGLEIGVEADQWHDRVRIEAPIVGQGGIIEAVRTRYNRARAVFTGTMDAISATANSIEKVSNALKSFSSGTRKARTKIDDFWDMVWSGDDLIIDIIVNLFYALTAKSILHASLAILNLFRKIFLQVKRTDIWKNFWTALEAIVSLGSPERPQTPRPQQETSEFDGISSLGTVLFSMLSSLCSVKCSPPTSFKGLRQGLFDFSNTARSATFVKKYLVDTLEFTNRVFKMFTARFAIPSDEFALISGLEDTRLQAWLTDAVYFTAAENLEKIMASPKLALASFELELVGRAFNVAMMTDGAATQKLMTYVQKVLKDLSRLNDELRANRIFSSVKYEPAVIWISGKPGIGKSRLTMWLMEQWAAHRGITMPNFYYSLSPGVKHCDGMENKPVVLIDDALSISLLQDPNFVLFWLQGKSCAHYRPSYAALEKKGTIPVYQDVFVTSNKAYFGNEPGVLEADAFNRRRTILIDAEARSNFTSERIKKMKSTECAELQHLHVKFKDPVDSNAMPEPICANREIEPYSETVRRAVFERLDAYHRDESKRYVAACKLLEQRLQTISLSADKTFMAQLSAFRVLIDSIQGKDSTPMPDLRPWLQDIKKNASFNPIIAEPMEEEQPEPTAPEEEIVEPQGPDDSGEDSDDDPPKCCHSELDPNTTILEGGRFFDLRQLGVAPLPLKCKTGCFFDSMHSISFKKKFLLSVYNSQRARMLQREPRDCSKGCSIPCEWLKYLDDPPAEPKVFMTLQQLAEAEQKRLREEHIVVNGQPLQKQPEGWCKKVWKSLCRLLLGLGFIMYYTVLVVGFICSLKIIGAIFSGDPIPQVQPSGDYVTLRGAQSVKHKAMQLVRPEMAEQVKMVHDDHFSKKVDKILGNTVFIIARHPETGAVYKGRCLGLYGKEVLVVKHYFDLFRKIGVKKVEIVRPRVEATIFTVDISDLLFAWGDCGYGMMTLPRSFPTQFKKITQLIASEELNTEYPAAIQIVEDKGVGHTLISTNMRLIQEQVVPANQEFEAWTIYDGFKYDWGGSGCCGSLILSPTLSSPIIGIHTAGIGKTTGFGERLYRESFDADSESEVEYITPQLETEGTVYQLDGSYAEVGRLDRDLTPNFPKVTSIVPSDISPVFPITTEPAPLSADDPRLAEVVDILNIGASKRCDPIKEFPRELVNQAVTGYRKDILVRVIPIRSSVGMLTVSQAIEGMGDKTGPIVMSTSEGFPWRSLRPKFASNKKWLFQLSETSDGIKVDGIQKDLYECLQYKHNQRLAGKVPASYFTCCLKDARILKTKVHIPGKTRIFEMSPIDLTIAQRQYCYDFVSSYMQSRFEHAIGINPDGVEWSDLANSLAEFSPYIITADYSAYGPRLNSELLYRAFEITTDWYKHNMAKQGKIDNDLIKVQKVLAHEIAHGLHVAGNLVFRPASGLPSGNIETVTKNSQCNSLYIRIAYLGLANQHAKHYADMYWFKQFVLLYTYGDDLIMSVKEPIISWFNNETLIEFFALYRLKMTDALKSGVSKPFCAIEEATFLKRGFLRHPSRPGQWLAPLERASVTDTVNWIRRSINSHDASIVNAEMSCRLAYTLGPDEFYRICDSIQQAWLERGVDFNFPSWESLDAHVWEGTPGPKFSF